MKAFFLSIFVATSLLTVAYRAKAEIKVIDDEVVFTLEAPGASAVFLVGDFNNWNPTLEKMGKIGDTYQSLLFLSPGVYHYQFVVDGQWTFDPDNEYRGDEGSLVVLEDRGGKLVIGTEDYQARLAPQTTLAPGIRYAGNFGVDDGDERSSQDIDVYVDYASELFRARANLKTVEDAWQLSPFESGLKLDRGMLSLSRGKAALSAFENDSSWTSSDPFELVGNVGVFDYNAGFARKGLAFELADMGGFYARAMLMDKLDTFPARPLSVPVGAFGGFASGSSADTTVYRFTDTHDDADSWGLELRIDQQKWGVGYGTRHNQGMHDGLVVSSMRQAAGFDLTTTTSREAWDANVVWARWRVDDGITIHGGYGHANAYLNTSATSMTTTTALGDVAMGQQSSSFETETRFQVSKRAHGRFDYVSGPIDISLAYGWSRFDFESFLYAGADAAINDYELTTRYDRNNWQASAFVRYLDQRYGETPELMHYFTPARNYWLDYDDKLDPVNMVRFDLTRSTTIGGAFESNPRLPFGWGAVEDHASLVMLAEFELVFDNFLGGLQNVSAEIGAERGLYKRFYGQADARIAYYDKSSWGAANKTYFAPYLEAGYRHKNIEISLGFGQDPVVLDRVLNMYYRNGRLKRLTRSVPDGISRGRAEELGEGLLSEEQSLHDDRTVKLELIMDF